ncbi:hypothetical protein Dsin_030195 [Dipteronia sinensis]|uniref:Uncharacterized protein n=1 Tax=Dipteronia sinensis TaxID=43782 RepID=A0AAD9ZKM1_9ROSI|nr:hypothetical protein Dsin_030195 [Dipteronia sinensis]
MNFNIGGPSNFLSTSSSSDDEEDQLIADLEVIDAEQEAIFAQHGNIQRAIAQYLNQQNNPVTREGSIPGHIVINRDGKVVIVVCSTTILSRTEGITIKCAVDAFEWVEVYFFVLLKKWKLVTTTLCNEGIVWLMVYTQTGLRLYKLFTIHVAGKKLFAMKQEGCRKDVERAFEALQSWFAIVAGPARFWHKHVLHDIMTMCIIMHNMIIEDERDVAASIEDHMEVPTPEVEMMLDENTRFQEILARHRQIRDKDAHIAL